MLEPTPSEADVLDFIRKRCDTFCEGQIKLEVHENMKSRILKLKKNMEIKITFISRSSRSTATKTLATIKIDDNTVTIEGKFRRKNNIHGLDDNFTCPRQSIAAQADELSRSLKHFIENSEMDISDVLDFIREGCAHFCTRHEDLVMREHIQSWNAGTNKRMDIKISIASYSTGSTTTDTLATITVDADTVTIQCLFKRFFEQGGQTLFTSDSFTCSRISINSEYTKLLSFLQKCIIAYTHQPRKI
jgi:hypothetical protein